MLEPGTLLLDRFRIDRLIGVGGMGLVYRAIDTSAERRVAVKILNEVALLAPAMVSRFHREAKLLKKLRHPHVIEVIEVGQIDDGSPFYVMELLEGRDLRQELRARGTIPIDEAAGYAIQAAQALSAVHRAGIVHRDLKPQNLFVTELTGARRIKLLDFGISKTNEEGEATLTATSGVLGTPYYMSPEQILAAQEVDARSDIWSLGVILYTILTGRLPFTRGSVAAVIAAIPSDPPDPFTNDDSHIPPSAREILLKCLEKDPARRFATADEVAVALLDHAPADGVIIAPEVNIPSTVPPVEIARRASLPAPLPRRSSFPPTFASERQNDVTIAAPLRFLDAPDVTVQASVRPLEPLQIEVTTRSGEETMPSSRRLAEARLPSIAPRHASRAWLWGALAGVTLAGIGWTVWSARSPESEGISAPRVAATPKRLAPSVPSERAVSRAAPLAPTSPSAAAVGSSDAGAALEKPPSPVLPTATERSASPVRKPKPAVDAASPSAPTKPARPTGADGAPLHL